MILMVLVVLPSSKPVSCDCSLCWSNTWILSIISAGIFLSTALGSLPKKGRPFTNTRCTSSPWACTLPSCTCMPGILVMRSSALASLFTLKASALNCVVSPCWVASGSFPSIFISFRVVPPSESPTVSMLISCLATCSLRTLGA